jgi:hypothetical protein
MIVYDGSMIVYDGSMIFFHRGPTYPSICKVLLTVHREISFQYEPTGCTIYFRFISITNLYMIRAGLLLIIRRYYSVETAICMCHAFMATGCLQDRSGNSTPSVNINALHIPIAVYTE